MGSLCSTLCCKQIREETDVNGSVPIEEPQPQPQEEENVIDIHQQVMNLESC